MKRKRVQWREWRKNYEKTIDMIDELQGSDFNSVTAPQKELYEVG